MDVRTLMKSPVLTVAAWMPASDALALLREEHVRHAVVRDGGELAGVVSDRDLAGAHVHAAAKRTVRDVMHAPAIVASPDETVANAAHVMRENHIGCLPIVERGMLVGIVTRSDLLQVLDPVPDHEAERPSPGAADVPRPETLSSPNRDKWP